MATRKKKKPANAAAAMRAQMMEKARKAIQKATGQKPIQADETTVPHLSTGSLAIDMLIGGTPGSDGKPICPGFPRRRLTEVYGPESSGKTTLTLQVLAEAQKQGGTAAFVDGEHALDPVYAEKLGVNMDELLVSQPDTGEQALEITDMLVRSGAVDVVVVDSVAARYPFDFGEREWTTTGKRPWPLP